MTNWQKKLIDAVSSHDSATRLWKARMFAAKSAYDLGDFRQCESLLHRELEAAETLSDRVFATNTCRLGLAAVYIATGHLDRAKSNLDVARLELSGRPEPILQELHAVTLRFCGEICVKNGELQRAEDELRESVEILTDLGESCSVQCAYALSDLALLLVLTDRLSEAKELLSEAMEILEATLGADSTSYAEVSLLFNVCNAKDEESMIERAEDGLVKLEYKLGARHPHFVRAVRYYLDNRIKHGDTDSVEKILKRLNVTNLV
ncbi:MAG TPA: hypothetical protein V6C89_16175 [Drouetiella sp.]